MKHMTLKRMFDAFNLQVFAGEGSEGDGTDTGDDDDQDEPDESDEGEDERRFTQQDVDEAVKKRLSRERKKWQRQQEKGEGNPGGGDNAGEKEDPEKKAALEEKSVLEIKVACYEQDVAKDSVDDVAALAKSYMAADDSLDLEDAIEKVVKKYPQFKNVASQETDGTEVKGSWGQRQSGKGAKKVDGVEAAFLKKNPGLKID